VSDKRESYKDVLQKIASTWQQSPDPLARLTMVTGYLLERTDNIIFTAIFLLVDGELTVRSYNGPPARPVLEKHKGICWACVDRGEPVVVANVHEFPGYIRREGPSNSEVSVPIKTPAGGTIGVLHVDSADFDAFDEVDVEYLVRIADLVSEVVAGTDLSR